MSFDTPFPIPRTLTHGQSIALGRLLNNYKLLLTVIKPTNEMENLVVWVDKEKIRIIENEFRQIISGSSN